ncbi:MAG: ABC transporter ATP-binding protein, partial [Chloroflexota bacterium]|nr:ABC transporter ATP-binding protein [Chloroflexota bacterium]
FEGAGEINSHHGTYEEYREKRALEDARSKPKANKQHESNNKDQNSKSAGQSTQKLSHNERREYKKLEKDIAKLEQQKKKLEEEINSGNLDHEEMRKKSSAYNELNVTLENKTERWFELAERTQ